MPYSRARMLVTPRSDRPRGDNTGKIWSEIRDGDVYRVIEIDGSYYRLQIRGEFPSLYPIHFFDVLSGIVEPGWVVSLEDEDESISLRFPETSARGFWEDVHDRDEAAIRIMSSVLMRMKESSHS